MKKWYIILLIFSIVYAFIMHVCVARYRSQPFIRVFSVGQGDAILIETPDHQNILVDAGPDDGILHHLGEVLPFGKHYLDAVILTHPHADHIGGMLAVFERYKVRCLFVGDGWNSNQLPQRIINKATALHVPVVYPHLGMQIRSAHVRHDRFWRLIFLAPFSSASSHQSISSKSSSTNSDSNSSINNLSLVLFYDGAQDAFLSGDMEFQLEQQLLARRIVVSAGMLKVGHHGSATSTSFPFLHAISPHLSCISVGKRNVYKHPSPLIIDRLMESGASVLRTDIDGDCIFRTGFDSS